MTKLFCGTVYRTFVAPVADLVQLQIEKPVTAISDFKILTDWISEFVIVTVVFYCWLFNWFYLLLGQLLYSLQLDSESILQPDTVRLNFTVVAFEFSAFELLPKRTSNISVGGLEVIQIVIYLNCRCEIQLRLMLTIINKTELITWIYNVCFSNCLFWLNLIPAALSFK